MPHPNPHPTSVVSHNKHLSLLMDRDGPSLHSSLWTPWSRVMWCSVQPVHGTRDIVGTQQRFWTHEFIFSSMFPFSSLLPNAPLLTVSVTPLKKQDTQSWTLHFCYELSPMEQSFMTSIRNSMWMKNYFCWIFALIFWERYVFKLM